ncbi:MAG: OmpA family protein, partial [Bacteroidetes bacterium]|nr:OmpA family protein [Bacteroidota bacterium]
NKPNKIEEYQRFYKKHIKECETAMQLKSIKIRAWVDNVDALNSPEDDYSPVITTDGISVIFNSTRENSHPVNDLGEYDADVYNSEMINKKWQTPKNLGDDFNTENDEYAVGLSFDGQKMLLFQMVDGKADIYESFLDGMDWTKPAPKFPKNVNTPEANETFACYHPNYIKVFYLSDKDGASNIYFTGVMDRDKNRWGNAYGGGLRIKSKDNEGSVYIHPDAETMFFSSQGFNSMGGYDIFMSKRTSSGEWGDPVNLGWPINTPYDERTYVPTASGKYAYIASDRDGGQGGFDIYKITYWGPEKPNMLGAEDFLLASMLQPMKENTMEKAVEVEKKSLTVFKGKVIDDITKEPVFADLEIVDNKTGEVIATLNSNKATGKFLLSLPAGRNYGIAVKAEGFLFHSENFNLPIGDDFNVVDKVIELKNIAIGKKIALRNVFFETGKANLSPESNTELARIVKLLTDVPRLKVEIGGHTDDVGSEESNQKLSEDRAKSVVNYLISQGIAKDRLTAAGYGESQPIAPNENKEGRALNRRTECMIVAN